MNEKFEGRLLTAILDDFDALASPKTTAKDAPAAAPTSVAPRRPFRPGILVGSLAVAAAVALVAGVVIGNSTGHSATPSAESSHAGSTTVPHLASPKVIIAAAVASISTAGNVSISTMTDGDGTTSTWYTDETAGIQTTVYTNAQGAVIKTASMRTDPSTPGQLQLIVVDDQARTWSSSEIGGTITPPKGTFLDQVQSNPENGKATVTGTTVIDGTPATVLVISAPDGSDPDTFYLDSHTLRPIKSVGPAGSPDVDYRYSDTLPDAGAWPTPPAGYAQTAWDVAAFKNS
jgi:hypothetical protein